MFKHLAFLILVVLLACASIRAQQPSQAGTLASQKIAAAGGGIAFDAASLASFTGNTTTSFNHTCTGSNLLLFVTVTHRFASLVTVNAPTYNGVTMTLVAEPFESDGEFQVHLYRLIAPATGTHSVTVTFSGTPADYELGATSFTGVHQTTPLGTPVTATGNSSAISGTISSASGEWGFDAVVWQTSVTDGATADSGQTERNNKLGITSGLGNSTKDGAASVVMSWTISASHRWATVVVPIKPA